MLENDVKERRSIMPKTAVPIMLLAVLSICSGRLRPGMAHDDRESGCFGLANRTYKLVNAALESERLAHFEKPDHRDSQEDVRNFTAKDFAGDPKATLAEAAAEQDAALKLLDHAADKQGQAVFRQRADQYRSGQSRRCQKARRLPAAKSCQAGRTSGQHDRPNVDHLSRESDRPEERSTAAPDRVELWPVVKRRAETLIEYVPLSPSDQLPVA